MPTLPCELGWLGGGATPVEPVVQWQTESQTAQERQDHEPRPLHRPQRVAGEVHAENNEHDQDVEDKAQGQSVLQDWTQAMKLKHQPIDEETIGHHEPNQRNQREPEGGHLNFTFAISAFGVNPSPKSSMSISLRISTTASPFGK